MGFSVWPNIFWSVCGWLRWFENISQLNNLKCDDSRRTPLCCYRGYMSTMLLNGWLWSWRSVCSHYRRFYYRKAYPNNLNILTPKQSLITFWTTFTDFYLNVKRSDSKTIPEVITNVLIEEWLRLTEHEKQTRSFQQINEGDVMADGVESKHVGAKSINTTAV